MYIRHHLFVWCKLLQCVGELDYSVTVGSADPLIKEIEHGSPQLPKSVRLGVHDVIGMHNSYDIIELVRPCFRGERRLEPATTTELGLQMLGRNNNGRKRGRLGDAACNERAGWKG